MIDTRDFLEKVMGLHTRPVEARGRIIIKGEETTTSSEDVIKWEKEGQRQAAAAGPA